jgi:hypothetical protein
VENTEKEPILVLQTRFYYMTTKSQKNSGNFCKIAEFCGRIGRKTLPRPDNSGGEVICMTPLPPPHGFWGCSAVLSF